MGLLTFTINVTLDGCVDHHEGIADDETHAFFTRLMDESGAMLWGRVLELLHARAQVAGDVVAVGPREDLSRRRHHVLRLGLQLDRPLA
jgi:hypothetical protein